ncbi:cutinase family protein [Rhodococcus sp. NPDC058521]|uniref:cutinase family protein n=1 Tax=Rhodococcus sp. NPDC058521 TaxID=3346536 RepID=UPI003654AB73
MKLRIVAASLGAALVAVAAPLSLSAPSAAAAPAPCADIDVVFARGTAEPAGLGGTGTTFVEALRALGGGKSVSSHAVGYPASADFGNHAAFADNVVDGIRDARAHIQDVAANCPGTKIVMGGYSQGAVVNWYATLPSVPEIIPPEYRNNLPALLPPEAADNIVAVVNFGKPSARFMQDAGVPPLTVDAAYAPKTVDYCIPFDNICDGQPLAQPNALHVLYAVNGMTVEGAQYALSRL